MDNIMSKVYNTDFNYDTVINISKDITFGTEIEFSGACYNDVQKLLKKQNNRLNGYKLKDDATVQCFGLNSKVGGELTTPICNDNIKTWKNLKYACELLISADAKINRNCSSHIHVGSNIFENNIKYSMRFFKLWAVYEDIIFYFCCNENKTLRNNINSYSKEIGRDIFLMYDQYYYNDSEIFEHLTSALKSKTHAIRLSDFNTIEIRVPAGTLNPTIIQNNINFFIKMILYCKSNKYNERMINEKLEKYNKTKLVIERYNDIDIEKACELANLIFDNELDKIKFLKQYLKVFKKNNRLNAHTKKYIYS